MGLDGELTPKAERALVEVIKILWRRGAALRLEREQQARMNAQDPTPKIETSSAQVEKMVTQ